MKLPEINPNQPIAIDLETCDPELKVTAPGYISNVGFVAGIAICAEEGAWYIPIGHAEGKNYDKEEVIKWLNKVLSADTEKIFHNAQYDVGWLHYMGVQLHGRLFDTMLAAPLLNENRFSYQLDSLGKIYCGEGKYEEALRMAVEQKFGSTYTHKTIIRLKEKASDKCIKYPEFIKAKRRTSQFYDIWPRKVQERYDVLGIETDKRGHEEFKMPCRREADVKGLLWAVDPEEMGTYPIQDVVLTMKLYKIFKKEITEEKMDKLMAMENELILPLLEMRTAGVRIDMDKAVDLDMQYTEKIKSISYILDQTCGFPVDINIDSDLIKICEKFNLKYKKTDKGNPCFSSEAVPKDELGIFDNILTLRKYYKARDTYIRGYIFGSTIDGWLHGQYNQLKSDDSGTVTGRLSSSCIASGTKITVPGGYKNIEDIQVGDVVYCYKNDGTITVSEVTNKFDKGIKPCVQVKWQSSGDKSTGNLICTPDHLIKTKYRGWIAAENLKRYDKIYHLRRAVQKSGRVRLYGANRYMEMEEQCLKREYFSAPNNMHIHHKDLNKGNNCLSNLQILSPEEHGRLHGHLKTPKWEHLLTCPRVILTGKDNPHYKKVSKNDLEKMVRDAKGVITKIPMDFDTFKKHCADTNFDYKKVAAEYRNQYKQLSEAEVVQALHNNNGSIVKARKELGVGYINFRRFCEEKGISYNHTITSVHKVEDHHVWDIEVKDYHNFIANELCVHNCPNMQNMPNPKSSQIGKDIRGLFIPDNDEEMWLSMDYSGQEPKMLVHTAILLDDHYKKISTQEQKEYIPGGALARTEEFRGRSADFHTAVSKICMQREFEIAHHKYTEDELRIAAKEFRPKAKSIGLGTMYGSGDRKIAEEMTKKGFPMTSVEAHGIRENIYAGVPFLNYLNKRLMDIALNRGYIKTILGRRGHFDLWECPIWDKDEKKDADGANLNFKSRQEAFTWYNENKEKYMTMRRPQRAYTYKALNKYIQGSSADQTKTAMLHLYKRGDLSLNALDIYYRRIPGFEPPKFKTQVHDEINVSLVKGEKASWYQDIMEHCIPLKVDVVADPVVCTRWSEAK